MKQFGEYDHSNREMQQAAWSELSDQFGDVPELVGAFALMRTELGVQAYTVDMQQRQAALLHDIDNLSLKDAERAQRAKQRWVHGNWGSASSLSADELQDVARTAGVNLGMTALEALVSGGALAQSVKAKLHERLLGGSELAKEGATPQDGDPRFDQVIWGHTLIRNPRSLLPFVGAHLMGMYTAATLEQAGVREASQKDYAISAMIDAAVMRSQRDQHDPVFQLWSQPKPDAFGWISPDRLNAFL